MPAAPGSKVTPTPLELAQEAVESHHAAQKPRELARLIEWLQERPEPRSVLEVGVYRGGTLWLWRRLWPAARIVAIDNMSLERCQGCEHRRAHRDCPNRRIMDALGRWPRGRFLLADSHEEHSRDLVTAWLGGGCDFLHVDGDHTAEGVRRDVELYGPLVRPGGAMVLHDVEGEAWPGVVELWRELLADESLWTRSPERDSGPFTIFDPVAGADWGGLGVVPR